MHLERIVRAAAVCVVASLLAVTAGCAHNGGGKNAKIGSQLKRQGDEIIVAGQFFHTGAPVVTWLDPGGYNAYKLGHRFPEFDAPPATAPAAASTAPANSGRAGRSRRAYPEPNQTDNGPYYSDRTKMLTAQEQQQIRAGWPLSLAQQKIDQFVYHYSVDPCSAATFFTLHDRRGLSVQFMLDLDGTIYQTLDATERAWHATKANDRSVGIEIANIGAYPTNDPDHTLDHYYNRDEKGPYFVVPEKWRKYIRTPNFVARPARSERVTGEIQGKTYQMYDLTPQQYDSLIKLTATLCTALPKIKSDYPRDEHGLLITHVLPDEQWEQFQGVLGHYHIQLDKQDPGPAFQWDKVVNGARKLMGLKPLPPGDIINKPAAKQPAMARAN